MRPCKNNHSKSPQNSIKRSKYTKLYFKAFKVKISPRSFDGVVRLLQIVTYLSKTKKAVQRPHLQTWNVDDSPTKSRTTIAPVVREQVEKMSTFRVWRCVFISTGTLHTVAGTIRKMPKKPVGPKMRCYQNHGGKKYHGGEHMCTVLLVSLPKSTPPEALVEIYRSSFSMESYSLL